MTSGVCKPTTYDIYDVTRFVDQHPCSSYFLRKCAGPADATALFEMAGHSDAAIGRLAMLRVPGLATIIRLTTLEFSHDKAHRS